MTTVPLGVGAYERIYSGSPEIKLENRWLESSPTNLREHVMLLPRPGTTSMGTFDAGSYGSRPMRGNYNKDGLLGNALFLVAGENLWRLDTTGVQTHVTGVVSGTGHPEMTWQKGIGYERLFISDGLLLQYYGGTTAAYTHLTVTGTITSGSDSIQVGGVYYAFNSSVDAGSPAGTMANPWRVNPGSDPLTNLVAAIEASGTPGTDYSTLISAPNSTVNAYTDGAPTPVGLIRVVAKTVGTGGNSISTTIVTGTHLAWGGTTLSGGGIDALVGVPMPDYLSPGYLASVSSYVLVSIPGTQTVYFILPGETTIDPLNFFEKESNPDAIVGMQTVGDQVLIVGATSAENWYATGDDSAPFAPIAGRVYQRGALAGTLCTVSDSVMLVGDDGVAYAIGYHYGTGGQWGVQRISNHGIEERIRRQIRRENGLSP